MLAAVALAAPVGARAADDGPLSRLDQIIPAVGKCWKAPAGLRLLERLEITARFSLKRNGELIGPPRITFSTIPFDTTARKLLEEATREAIARCTPVSMTESLGAAVAGKMIAVHFIYSGRKGQGV